MDVLVFFIRKNGKCMRLEIVFILYFFEISTANVYLHCALCWQLIGNIFYHSHFMVYWVVVTFRVEACNFQSTLLWHPFGTFWN